MYGQLIDIQGKLRHAESQLLRREAKIAEAEEILAQDDIPKSVRLGALADKIEQEADIPTWDMNLKGAQQELADIKAIMAELKPQCKFADLDILRQSEAIQQEEWLLELQGRAENFMLSSGSIPADHLQTMRCHPEFKERLVPFITNMATQISIASEKGPQEMCALLGEVSNVPLLK